MLLAIGDFTENFDDKMSHILDHCYHDIVGTELYTSRYRLLVFS